jgi:Domain of unknown function (DUF4160)
MPTVMLEGYRFFFFSNEGQEPSHIHVQSAENYAKFWLDPVLLAESTGYDARELNALHKIVSENTERFEKAWNDFFAPS